MRRSTTILLFCLSAVMLGWRTVTPMRALALDDRRRGTGSARAHAANDSLLRLEMRNVDLHINPRSDMHVRSLRGQVISTDAGAIAWLDQPATFRARATSGVVALDGNAISALLNEVAFNYSGAPIKNLRVTIENGSVVQRGTLHKGVPIPFQMWPCRCYGPTVVSSCIPIA